MTLSIGGFNFKIRRPLLLLGLSSHELTFRLGRWKNPSPAMPDGYRQKSFHEGERKRMQALLHQCGFPFSQSGLEEALALCIPDGIHLIEHKPTGRLVSMMMSRHLASPEFPWGGADRLAGHGPWPPG